MCVNLITIQRIWGGEGERDRGRERGGGGEKWQKVYLPNYHLSLPGEAEEWKAANYVVYVRVHKQSTNYISLTIKVIHSAGRVLAN